MEVSYMFYLGPIAVSGLITASRRRDGSIISPVNKSLELKPGLFLQLAGPYEDSMEYISFLKERFELNSNMDGPQAAEDLKWLSGKDELDVQDFLDKYTKLMKDAKRYQEGRMNEKDAENFNKRFEEIKLHPMSLKIENPQGSPEVMKENNLKVSHIHLTQALEKGFVSNRVAISDVFVNHYNTRTPNDKPQFDTIRIDPGNQIQNEEGHAAIALGKKMMQYVSEARKNPSYAANILKNTINEHHYKFTINPQPLQFIEVGQHTDWRWILLED